MSDQNEVSIVITATDKASIVLATVSRAFNAITSAVKDVTREYVEYGDQVKSLSAFLGTNMEETSRTIQLMDDAFISTETWRTAARRLADEGIQPTTDNLARLSDQFLAIQDPAERSQWLLDNFGRAGVEMAKAMELGGDSIRSMSADIADGLIIDEQKYQAIQANKRAVDDFNDSIQATKYEVAGKLLEIYDGLPEPLKQAVLYMGMLTDASVIQSLTQILMLINNIKMAGAGGAAAAGAGKAVAGGAAAGAGLLGGAGAVIGFGSLFAGEQLRNQVTSSKGNLAQYALPIASMLPPNVMVTINGGVLSSTEEIIAYISDAVQKIIRGRGY